MQWLKKFKVSRAMKLNREAFFYVEQGKLQKAINLLENALKWDPDSGDCHNELSICYVGLGKYELAEKEARAALSCDPNNTKFKNAIIGILLKKASMSKSRKEIANKLIKINQEIENMISMHPEYPPFHLSRALALALGGAKKESWELELDNAVKKYQLTKITGATFLATEKQIRIIIEKNRRNCIEMNRIWENLSKE